MKLSIIIPVINLKEITQICLDSLQLYTKDYELIVIDNGSKEKTKKYLQGLKDIILIRNKETVGYSTAMNQGDKVATGDYIVYSNNDVVFTPYWAERMVAHFERDKKLGLLGITTNRVEGYQHIDYCRKGVDIEYVDILTGICLMLKKEISDKLKQQDGYIFDTRFDPGGQEDADLAIRIKKLNLQVAIARDVFLYHYGSASFREIMTTEQSYKYPQSRVKILRDKYNKNMNTETTKSIQAQQNNVGLANNKPLIFIAVCTMGTIRTEMLSILIRWTHNPNFRIIIHPTINIQPLDAARNTCVKEFMKISNSPDDRLCFLDDDILPPADAIDRLYSYDKDAVSGTCFVMKNEDNGDYFPYSPLLKLNKDNKFIVYYGQGLERIDGCGGGFILIKRKVFEKMDKPYEYVYYPDGTLELVADFNLCLKMKKLGFELWADYGLLCDHIKPVSILGFQNLLAKIKNEN